MNKTEAIYKFLQSQPYPLGKLYTEEMEVQVNVAQGDGKLIEGEYLGKHWKGYTDGLTTWKPFRIPWDAKSNPHYEDKPIVFDISKHIEAIGMTGWNYKQLCSCWVGFDFDSIVTHAQGLNIDELKEIQEKLTKIPFVSAYTSTGGNGLHIYVFISDNKKIKTHTEHALVARTILDMLSAHSGLILSAKADAVGGNMWVWHRKCQPDKSFMCLKQGIYLDKIPEIPQPIVYSGQEQLIASQIPIDLNEEHIKLIKYLEKHRCFHWWDSERSMLVCHTFDLKQAHRHLKLQGFFDTVATGKDHGHDKNCFAFPGPTGGGWILRRFTRGTSEHACWYRDTSDWTTCNYNQPSSLRTASRLVGGIESERSHHYLSLDRALEALRLMGINLKLSEDYFVRSAEIRETNNKIILEFPFQEGDNLEGFLHKQKSKVWQKFFSVPQVIASELHTPDDLVRHIVINSAAIGWVINNGSWTIEPRNNVTSCLTASGTPKNQVELLIGKCILQPWQIVCKPFQPEYPGKRQWNKNAPQLCYVPKKGTHPTWDKLISHIGHSTNNWLLSWISALFQEPEQPLPYLVLWGMQNTGKSILHEALSLLITKGVIRADHALVHSFNAELENAILCVVEEIDLSRTNKASERIKDWVVGQRISIHGKGRTPYDIPNHTHWIQCTNDPSFVPVFPGDTRIVMIEVHQLSQEIPKPQLLDMLKQEAPEFLYTILHFSLPEKIGRLRVPVISTEGKEMQMERNKPAVQVFLDESLVQCNGQTILLSELYVKFSNWLDPGDSALWNMRRFSRELLALGLTKGKYGKGNNMHLANWCYPKDKLEGKRLVFNNGRLV